MKKNVVLTGGTGFIGKKLTQLLLENGFSVSILSRTAKKNLEGISYFQWDVDAGTIDEQAIVNADYVIHLAGENIGAKRWTTARKKAILDSREKSTQLLYACLQKNNKQLEAFISASGVGIYGAITDELVCTELTPAASDFLGTVCQKWESATVPIRDLGIRTVQIRTALVLGKGDGVLQQLLPLFRYKLGSAIGSGKQYMPWIHIDDLCRIYLAAITNSEMQGPYNAAVNDSTTNTVFSNTLAKVIGYTIWMPNVPAFVLQLALGQIAQLVLKGRRVASDKIEKTGFQFRFTNLEKALKDCLS
nr:TIGR01777 family oxidoreductase [uncultured Flavobacterium sp.]